MEFVNLLCSEYKDKIIFLFRRKNLETPQMLPALRFEILRFLNGKDSILDLDVFDQEKELKVVEEEALKIKMICSYHNYNQTPNEQILESIINAMQKFEPFIYKLATFCKSESDAFTLLNFLTELKSKQRKFIVLGMGELGAVTRIFGTLWGNEMLFAPTDEAEATAPGQYTRAAYQKIFEALEQ